MLGLISKSLLELRIPKKILTHSRRKKEYI